MRLFVAADLSDEQRSLLRQAVETARQSAPFDYVRWIPEENWHATLAFLGDRPESELGEIESTLNRCLASVESLESVPSRIQGFPNRDHPRLLALKLSPSSAIQSLYWQLNEGLNLKERTRHLRLHITVARFRELDLEATMELVKAIRDLPVVDSLAWNLPAITLYESSLKQTGAEYGVVKRWLFGRDSRPNSTV